MTQNVLSFLERSTEVYPRKATFSDEHTNLTYRGLSDLSMRIDNVLAQKTGPCRPVPVLTEKNVFILGVFTGIIRADYFYVCLDANQPAGCLNRVLDTPKADLVVADKESLDLTAGISLSGKTLFLEDLKSLPDDTLSSSFLALICGQAADTDLLYRTFTSGPTNMPKGVMVNHRSVIGFIQHFTDLSHTTRDDVIDDQAPFDFNVSVKDIYSVLKTGAMMEIILKKLFSIPTDLLGYLCDRKITTAIWTTSALRIIATLKGFTYRIPPHPSKILFSGEVMSVKHLNIWRGYLSGTPFANLYDPTEITCNYTHYVMDREFEPGIPLPIGVPFPNETIFLLDESNRLVIEPGQNGELCVAGTVLALGYHRDPKRTTTVFVQNPLNPCHPEIIYRTNDLACYSRDGLLYFNRRKDFQIKHMEHRIELGEIEAVLETMGGVDRAVCLFLEKKNKIAAFYEGAAVRRDITVDLEHLPPCYMFPALYRNLAELPRTKNGKVDRQALKRLYGQPYATGSYSDIQHALLYL